ncbi:MAG TPA: Tim44/TimA family putative adaptor protein [Bauldia sp.]|nr:Tim44/TimA family putative adaptor protein [Bauldia sp.]
MSGFTDLTSVIFLVIAVVVFIRLRSVLGRRTGNERPPYDPYTRRDGLPARGGDKVVDVARRIPAAAPAGAAVTATIPLAQRIGAVAPEGSPVNDGLKAIAVEDPALDPSAFVAGAKVAYEMIVTAFAEGDRKTLKPLLGREVFDGFVSAIAEREQRGETIEFKFVGIDRAEITAASLKGGTAQITVRFLSKLVSATHDKAGKVIDGDPTHVGDVTDVWTFARETASRDPNWKLVATESVE